MEKKAEIAEFLPKVKGKKRDPGVTERDRRVLELWMAGATMDKIADDREMSKSNVWRILKKPSVEELRKEITAQWDGELQRMYRKVIDKFLVLLDSQDENVVLKAIQTWLKVMGKDMPKREVEEGARIGSLTAEKVVFQILNRQKDLK